jgi:hypothetical protein
MATDINTPDEGGVREAKKVSRQIRVLRQKSSGAPFESLPAVFANPLASQIFIPFGFTYEQLTHNFCRAVWVGAGEPNVCESAGVPVKTVIAGLANLLASEIFTPLRFACLQYTDNFCQAVWICAGELLGWNVRILGCEPFKAVTTGLADLQARKIFIPFRFAYPQFTDIF